MRLKLCLRWLSVVFLVILHGWPFLLSPTYQSRYGDGALRFLLATQKKMKDEELELTIKYNSPT